MEQSIKLQLKWRITLYFINLIKTDGSDTITLYEYNFNGPSVSPEGSTPDTNAVDSGTTTENTTVTNNAIGNQNYVANTSTTENNTVQ